VTRGVSILVVDDEPAFREGLRQALNREGFLVHLAADGVEALEVWRAQHPDLVLLDVMLPRMSGIDVCREIRSVDETPVIMVSARNEEIDAVIALEVGADDYVTKPYRVRELVARMRTVLRRANATHAAAAGVAGVLEVADLVLDRERHEVSRNGEPVQLPLKEFDLLALLMENSGLVVTKVETNHEVPSRIVTIRGLGYKLTTD
jgi:two-component system response regulator RegX3